MMNVNFDHVIMMRKIHYLLVLIMVILYVVKGDLRPTFGRCCAAGANWARESQECSAFSTIVTAVPNEHQSICITAATICCIRYFRYVQCGKGKQAAEVGQECVAPNSQGGEYFKDCCQGCKLGLFSGTMGMGCGQQQFKFGVPWDDAFLQCCNQATPNNNNLSGNQGLDNNNLFSGLQDSTSIAGIEFENLCEKLPGKLCSDLCVPTPGSYRCMCRPGFTLSRDGKTCILETVTDRCEENNPCDHICLDTGVSIVCSCNAGFILQPDQKSCEDVDECVDGTNNCNWTTHFCVNTQGGYTCEKKNVSSECIAGYKFSTDQQTCIDVDECEESSHTCDRQTQTCINSQGSYRCMDQEPMCEFGYRYSEELKTCVDIDECAEGLDFCNRQKEMCVNNEGNYWCNQILHPNTNNQATITTTTTTTTTTLKPPPLPTLPPNPALITPICPLGTKYSHQFRACIDIDECEEEPCKPLEVCENTQGSYECSCLTGYFKDAEDEDCQDINECQINSHSCTSTQRCDNTVGSYACIRIAGCGTGYTLNHNTGQCDDNDECKLNTHNCHQLGAKYQCHNLRGSFRCRLKTCPPLQILTDEGVCVDRDCGVGFRAGENSCIDIDECTEGNPCRRNERCINTLGSYTCHPRLFCHNGYEMNEAGTQCVDIDECVKGTHECEENQVCTNKAGFYMCHCPQGFRLNAQRKCIDIDECENYYGRACPSNSVCENTEGSYVCHCKDGFKQESNGISCIDVNECEETPDICQHNCINVWGTYQCTCRAGHILNADNRTCTDVDECENYRGAGYLCIGVCVNVPGSFECTCPDGYKLAADKRTCKDINECETSNVCLGIDEQCVNTQGGYKCNTIRCPPDYVRDSTHKNRCKRVNTYCQLNDEACRQKPLSYSYNFLPLVSNLTLPSVGQVNLFTMRGPLWQTTTVQFDLQLEDVQAPTGVEPVTRDYFQLRRTAFNQAVISLVKTMIGPQEVQLALNMKLYQQGRFSGSAVAKLLLYVSQYSF